MTETPAVLFANEVFYVAFLNGDYDSMESLWATGVPVSCIHPGWHHLTGRDVVMESWYAMMTNNEPPAMEFQNATATVYGNLAVVICYEAFSTVTLVATNIFIKEDGLWKMIHHQAGGSSLPPSARDEPEEPEIMQ